MIFPMKKISNEEMNEIIDEYTNPNIKVSDIINSHKLNIPVNQLRSILPLLKSEVCCKYCGTQMSAMYPTRNNIKKWKFEDFVCDNCGHELHNSSYSFRCKCSNCNETRKQIAAKQLEPQTNTESEPTLENVQNKYPYHELSIKEQMSLLFLLLINGNDSWSHIIAGKTYSFYCLSQLLTMITKGYIHPNTNKDYASTDYLSIDELNYGIHTVNVEFTEEEREELMKGIYFLNNYTPEELTKIYHEYLYRDIMIQFGQMMIDRGLEEPYENRTLKEQFIDLLQKISYKQLLRLCTKCANFYLEKVTLGQITKSTALRKAMNTVINLYTSAVAKDWDIFPIKTDDINPELFFFLRFVLNRDKDILNEVAIAEKLFSNS